MSHPPRSRLLADSTLYLAGNIAQRGLPFLILPFATRALGPSEFGSAALALAVANVLSMLFAGGLNFAIVRLFYDEPTTAARTEWALLVRVAMISTAVLAGIAWLAGPLWSDLFDDVGWGAELQLAVILAAAMAIQNTCQGVLRAQRRSGLFTVVSVAQLAVGAPVALWLAHHEGAPGYVGGFAAGAATAALVAVIATYRKPAWRWNAVLPAIALSLPFLFHWLSGWVLNLSDRIFIERYRPLSELGQYQVAYTAASALSLVLDSAQAAWAPHYFGDLDGRQKRDVPAAVVMHATVGVGALALILVALGPAVMAVAAPDAFGYPSLVIALVAAVAVVRVPYLMAAAVVFDAKRSRPIAAASAAAAALNLGLVLGFVPRWGINAAAAATLSAYALQALLVDRAAARLLGTRLVRPRLIACWVGGVAAAVGLSAAPRSALGWVLRVAVAGVAIAIAWTAFRRTREGYRRAMARAEVTPA